MSLRHPVVDLYCGAGGLSLGLSGAGLTPVFAADHEPTAISTYRRNLGAHARCLDIAGLRPSDIQRALPRGSGEIALVAGGPPCQGFSVQRRGATRDERNDHVLTFTSLALALRPRMVLMENVPGLVGRRGRRHLERVLERMDAAGYGTAVRVLRAEEHGVPSRRRRVFVVAWRRADVAPFRFPGPSANPPGTVRSAIGDLPEPRRDHGPHPQLANHLRVRISALNARRIAHVPAGGGRLDIPVELQLPCHRNAGTHRHLDVFGRMEWDKPAPTITAVFDNFSRGRFAHPERDRVITAREGARLQSFPDDFVFEGAKKQVARQIGNAVPPRLARAIGEQVRASLEQPPTVPGS